MNFILKNMNKLKLDINKNCRYLCDFVRPENLFTSRTHTCGEITIKNIGQSVVICGWLQYRRQNKFAILRDSYGSVQVIIPQERLDLIKTLSESFLESVICIHGKVIERPESQVNKNMATGDIEIEATEYEILNNVKRNLPFLIRNHNKAKENIRMKYRYLDLRGPEMQRNLRLRSEVIFSMRKYLIDKGFIEVETPTLFKRTPGGAQEYLVPTEFPGEFYALVQSPQQLKQLLMVGGVDRYFQVARCYRNEGARPDRQPEFSQLDIEVSFTNDEDIMNLVEEMIHDTWPQDILGPLPTRFPRISYNDSLQYYGSDKPNLASDIKIQRLDEDIIVTSSEAMQSSNARFIVFPKISNIVPSSLMKKFSETKKNMYPGVKLFAWKIPEKTSDLLSLLKKNKIDVNFDTFVSSCSFSHEDLVFMAMGSQENKVLELLGRIRNELIEYVPRLPDQNKWNMVWVCSFPLFEKNDDTDCLQPMHHPFTQPYPEDLHLLDSNPLQVRGLHYDLVLNGCEIAGGSVRIHSSTLQEKILRLLQISPSSLQHMIEALESGAPPHAGIAFGLDRYISLMVNSPSIRNVIAFPKTSEGRDLMSSAPCPVSQEELDLYKICVNKHKESGSDTSNFHANSI